MFENLPKNQNNDRILLPNSSRKLDLPDGRIVTPSFVLREESQELILSCGYNKGASSTSRHEEIHSILIPAHAIRQIQTRGIGLKLFGGAFVDATFIFDRPYEAKMMDTTGNIRYQDTDKFQMPLKHKDLEILIERINLLNIN